MQQELDDDQSIASAIIRQFEGCHLNSYILKGEEHLQATIGWGHAIPLIDHPMTVNQATAVRWLLEDLDKFKSRLRSKLPLTTFDSMTSFESGASISWAFNCKDWERSSTFKHLIDGDKDAFIVATSQWIHGEDGRVLAGLVRRRACERHIFVRNSIDEVIKLAWYMRLLPLVAKTPLGQLVWQGTEFTWSRGGSSIHET